MAGDSTASARERGGLRGAETPLTTPENDSACTYVQPRHTKHRALNKREAKPESKDNEDRRPAINKLAGKHRASTAPIVRHTYIHGDFIPQTKNQKQSKYILPN